MPCTLRQRGDLSINDIVTLARNHDVKVTPHVGNWTPARLVLPTLGLTVLCVDHTIGVKDVNAHPHLLIRDGVARPICDHAERLTTHSRVTRKYSDLECALGASLAEVHVGAARKLYPQAHITTHSEEMAANKDVMLAALEIVTDMSPNYAWWRYVTEEGNVTCHDRTYISGQTWQALAGNIFPLTNAKRGWLVHNRIAILMDIILQSGMGREPEIYHLSGPDMVRYLGGEMTAISRMYDVVRKRLGLVQETVVFNLVPFASFRFATRSSQAAACTSVCEQLANPVPDQRALREWGDAARDIFSETETRSYFTQHDCLAHESERILVPEIVRDWSMDDCAARLSALRAAMA